MPKNFMMLDSPSVVVALCAHMLLGPGLTKSLDARPHPAVAGATRGTWRPAAMVTLPLPPVSMPSRAARPCVEGRWRGAAAAAGQVPPLHDQL